MPRPVHLSVAVSAGFVLAACGSHDAPTAPAQQVQGIKAVAGGGAMDTVLSSPLQALVVEVRGPGGALAKGATVRFSVQPPADTTRRSEAPLYVCELSAATCGPTPTSYPGYPSQTVNVSTDTADANGRAKAIVRLGTVAGPSYVIVTVPELGMKDSVPFTVRPGAAHRVSFSAGDVALVTGAKATLKASVLDAYNNPRAADTVAYSLGGAPGVATLDAASATVTAVDIGTAYAIARAGAAHDSVAVRVVPSGRLLVWEAGTRIVRLVSTDGSAPKTLATSISSDYGAFPRFSPNGTWLAFQAGTASDGGAPQRVIVMDSAGGNQREIGLPSGVTSVTQPRVLADGRVLLVGRGAVQYGSYPYTTPTAVYSVATDGTVTTLATLANASTIYGGIDISPDGSRVAYVVDPSGFGQSGALQVLNFTNGQTTQVEANASAPSWSPSSDRVAFLVPSNTYGADGTLATVKADGTERTTLAQAGTFSPGLAWSPSGAYVLGRSTDHTGGGLRAVRSRDGVWVALRLPAVGASYAGAVADYYQPDWR